MGKDTMRSPTKNDIAMARIQSGARKFVSVCDVIKALFKYATFTTLIVCCFWGLGKMVDSDAGKLDLIAKIIESYKLHKILPTVAAVIFGAGWYFENRRVGRLVKKSGDTRHLKEQNDKSNGRSGLDDYGHATEDRED